MESKILTLLSSQNTRDEGFKYLVDSYGKGLYYHIRRLVVSHQDAEDILQESLIKIYRNIDSFKSKSSLKTWMYKIATNECLASFRKQHIESLELSEMLIGLFANDSSIDYNSLESKFQLAILSLPERQRLVFTLRYYDEMSYEQIAEVIGGRVGAHKSNYHYAEKKLKEYMLSEI